jgi:hypothetical protein
MKQMKKRGQTILEYVLLLGAIAGASSVASYFLFGAGSPSPTEVGYMGKALAEYKAQISHQSTEPNSQKFGGRSNWKEYYNSGNAPIGSATIIKR